MRGAAATVVKNMTSSLEVPTATSVRAVPAKLMADNRIVINNFLKRNRGGKISFTHLIGYAIVRAIADYPSMNRHFAVVDGKPTIVTPAHVNLGLAIDLPGKGGSRNLVVVPIKGAETMSFTQFWSGYEQIVRKARAGSLTAEDYAGTTISLTNPGGIGTNHSVPRLMSGQSAIIGVGALEYPAEFQGASDPDAVRPGHFQDHHADLDLRPPGDPGRRVRRVPAPHPPAADRRGRLLRRGLHLAAAALRAGALGAGPGPGPRRRTSTRPPGCWRSSTRTAPAAT